jgi:hypothetical protein
MVSGERLKWIKRRCDTGACVEIAFKGDQVCMRDSKDPDGPTLEFARETWEEFLNGVRAGAFD